MSPENVEWRLAAILAADVAGYSRLMGADEVGTMTALRSHRSQAIDPRIAEHHGRIVNTAGDSILAEFASVADAVRCAVDIQNALAQRNASIIDDRRIVLRIGINVGEVMVQGGEIYGDTVNIAARLEQLCDPGGVFISSEVRSHLREKLAFQFEDLGPKQVKNIARPVGVCRVRWDGLTPGKARPPRRIPSLRRVAWIAALAVLLAGVALAWTYLRANRLDSGAKPGIAVLPFVNLSQDKEQEYLSDGLTEDIITELSHFSQLKVISRNSSFRYRGESVDLPRIGRELNVRYVLQGSVRKVGAQLRISGQLIDVESGSNVWAQYYDRPLKEVLAVQEELSRSIIPVIVSNVIEADLKRAARKPPEDLTAYDLTLQGRRLFVTRNSKDRERARAAFEQAIAADPTYAEAYAGLANVYVYNFITKTGTLQGNANLDEALKLAQKAVQLDPSSSLAYVSMSSVYLFRKQHDLALSSIEHAVRVNPNDSLAWWSSANIRSLAGQQEVAEAEFKHAKELDPFPPPAYYTRMARPLYMLRKYDQAVAFLNLSISQAPQNPIAYAMLAACYTETGHMEQARQSVRELLKQYPKFTLANVEDIFPFRNPEDLKRVTQASLKAGIPPKPL